jgi:endogenous inhibitor of DNA gyrase (YacG/DUF329 family)
MVFHCPICGKKINKPAKGKKQTAQTTDFFPFCSQRCKLIDLNAWLESEYIIYTPIEKQKKDKPDESENMLK